MAYIPIKAQTTNTNNYSQFKMANRWVYNIAMDNGQ